MAVAAPPKPRAVTAVVAGVLALLGGLWFVTGVFMFGWLGLSQEPLLIPSQVTDAFVGLVLLLGGLLLLARTEMGRALTLIGAVLGLVAPIVGTVLLYQRIYFVAGGPTGIEQLVLRRVVVALPFVAILVLTLLPATRRWTRN